MHGLVDRSPYSPGIHSTKVEKVRGPGSPGRHGGGERKGSSPAVRALRPCRGFPFRSFLEGGKQPCVVDGRLVAASPMVVGDECVAAKVYLGNEGGLVGCVG
jgi:hypothetical protein